MPKKVLEFKTKNKVNGTMEIKNQTNNSADLYFYGDIVSTAYNPDDWWSPGSPEDRAPQDVADFLNQLDGMTDVNIHINSGGGDVFAGVAIYNILKNNIAKKIAYVDGLAASSASLIPFACDTVIVPSSAQLMIHNPWTIAVGNANDFRSTADMLDQVAKSIINIYMDNVKDGVTEEQIKQMMDEEKWMTGQEASQIFNIQVDTKASVAACADSEFFSKYIHLPKNLMSKPKANNESEIENKLNSIIERLDKIENSNSSKQNNNESDDLSKQKINNLKAKLALKCKL